MRLMSDIADRLDEAACYSNVYRATRHWFAEDYANRRTRAGDAGVKLRTLERFADLEFDDVRSLEQRRRQLDRIGSVFLDAVGQLAEHARSDCRRNLAVQGHLQHARRLFVGARGPDSAIAYLNRCRPNLTMPPKVVGTLMVDEQFRPAIRTAHELAGAHDGLKGLLGDAYFRRRLYSPTVAKGGQLTHRQIAADLAVLGALSVGVRWALGAPALPALQVVAVAAACIYVARFFAALGKRRPFEPFDPPSRFHALAVAVGIGPDTPSVAVQVPMAGRTAVAGGA